MVWFKIYFTFIFALLGSVMGSFLNCWAERYAEGEKYPRGRSHCPKCGHTLAGTELIPIVSFLVQRGRCKSCHERISVRYPVTECLGALLFAAAFLRFGLSLYTAELLILTAILMVLSFIDYDTMLLPGAPMIAGLINWAAFLLTHDDWKARALRGILTALILGAAILALSVIMDKLLGRESLGGGDIKLFALCALYLGPWSTLLMVILSCLLGLIFAVLSKKRGTPFPFGPAISLATALTLLFGDPVVEWYMGLL